MKTIILTFLVFGLSVESFAKDSVMGAGSSGGGFAVVCRNNKGLIDSAELLDLYEAKNKFNYELLDSSGSLEGDYLLSVRNTYRLQGYGDEILVGLDARKNLDLFLEKIVFLNHNQTLPSLYDLGEHLAAPLGCAIEPLAIWYGKGEESVIKVKSEIWDRLSSLDQAALAQHEIAYNYYRELYEKTSEGSRAFVAVIFSKNAKPTLDARTKKLKIGYSAGIEGSSVSTAFRYEKVGEKLVLHLTHLAGRAVVSKAVAEINVVDISLVNSNANNKPVVIALGLNARVERVKVITQQSNDWEIEFSFTPEKPVKVTFFQKGILIEETFLQRMF